ncbi:MAG: DNA internalization-related competence protein ComEC/Rec2 [Pseudomonadota bacterium]|nr:DNA internalization-related competence protein ComEC/Rec2 [Pseudomonadota bacterium]
MSFASGVIVLYALPALPPYSSVLIICALVLVLALMPSSVSRWRVHPLMPRLCLVTAMAFAGLSWAGFHAAERLEQTLPDQFEGREVAVEGYLCSLPQPGSFRSLRFNLCVSHWPGLESEDNRDRLPSKLRLAWYGANDQGLPGHRLSLTVVLKRPHGQVNQHGFRYEDWLFRHQIGATGSVRAVALAPDVACGWSCQYHRGYAAMAAAVDRQFARAEQLGLITSLLIGNRAHLSDEHWQTLKATGTIHLVAISGLHLGLLAAVLGFLVRRAMVLVPAAGMSERRRRQWIWVTVVAGCLGYALLAGFSVPTQRALIMVAVASGYWLLARQSSPWRPYLLALAIVLLLDPLAPLDQGFWLSFGAVGILVLAFAGRLVSPGWLRGLLVAQVAIFAALWPILAWQGQAQPLAGFVANLVAIPWVSLVVMPLLFLFAPLAFIAPEAVQILIQTALDGVLGGLWYWLDWIAGLNWPTLPRLPLGVLVLQGALVLLMLRIPDTLFRRCAALVLVMVWAGELFGPANERPAVRQPTVTLWDVGQGLSVLIRDGQQVVLYDTGPGVPGVFSAAESVLLPGLSGRGIAIVDLLVISHADSDHAGGLDVLVPALDIRHIVSGEPDALTSLLPDTISVDSCPSASVSLERLELHFWRSATAADGNDASCVMVVHDTQSGARIWLPGDISRAVEQELLAAEYTMPEVQPDAYSVMVAPHHGSKTSSSDAWVNTLQPDLVIYTAGYRHRYGHPHPEVQGRYEAAGSEALSTACSGELTLTFGPERLAVAEARAAAPFWIHPPGPVRDLCNSP